MKKNRWTGVYKSEFKLPVAGVYKANLNTGRTIFTYAKSVEDAVLNVLKTIKWEEQIKTISRESFKEN